MVINMWLIILIQVITIILITLVNRFYRRKRFEYFISGNWKVNENTKFR